MRFKNSKEENVLVLELEEVFDVFSCPSVEDLGILLLGLGIRFWTGG